jgi:hypothetical protein
MYGGLVGIVLALLEPVGQAARDGCGSSSSGGDGTLSMMLRLCALLIFGSGFIALGYTLAHLSQPNPSTPCVRPLGWLKCAVR